MKKTVLFVAMAIVALCAAATDRFYIEDFSISAGETRTVSIMLDNETEYTAFQTDLYLPAGLTVEQEDGDYIFDLTDRKGRDHNIASQVQADGAIRIMSYSPTIKTYSGNSGALVTFNVTATGEFGGSATIELKNTLFTTKNGVEVSLNDETSNVTIILKDLTGEINICFDFDEDDDWFPHINVCYTGDEDVKFYISTVYSCVVNQLYPDEEDYEENLEHITNYSFPFYSEHDYGGDFFVSVVVGADGYNEIRADTLLTYWRPTGYPNVCAELTPYTLCINIDTWMSNLFMEVTGDDDGEYTSDYNNIDGDLSAQVYAYRLDHDYEITVRAAQRPMYYDDDFLVWYEETYRVPAHNNGLEIKQCGPNGEISEVENNHFALIRYYGDSSIYYYGDEEKKTEIDLNDFLYSVHINDHTIDCENYNSRINYLKIDDEILIDWEDNSENVLNYGPISYRPDLKGLIVDLIPFGDEYGGKYDIDASAFLCDPYCGYEHDDVNAEAHFEYYVPIEAPTIVTQMTNDAVIVNMSSDMDYKKFIVDGEEVLELPYVAGRTSNDYYITVQAGHSPDSVRWAWTEEMSILIPAREVPLLRGDVDGDGNVNISDVTALIDYLLSGSGAIVSGKPDVDLNGSVTIADVTSLIDYLLSGRWPGETSFTVNGVTFKLLDITGGIFSMGATPEQGENANDNEKPVHQVALSPFSMSVTEVTQELWLAVMGTNPSRFSSNLNRPVENVSWNDCQVFIAKLNELTGQNFRLPTEAEWEFAARGGMNSEGYIYAGSNELDEIAWYNYNAHAVGSSSPDYGTHAAATKAPNELGLYDMTGNVWEWCQDWSGAYSAEDQINPTGPSTGTNRVIRGGGWTNYPSLLRIAARTGYKPTFKGNFIGLRLAL